MCQILLGKANKYKISTFEGALILLTIYFSTYNGQTEKYRE